MKINKIIILSFKRIKRNRKRNSLIILPIIFMMLFLLFVNMIQYSIQEYVKQIKNNIDLRTIDGIRYSDIDYEEKIQKLQHIEHIDGIIDMLERKIYADTYCEQINSDKSIIIAPTDNNICPEVIKGTKINNNYDYNIIIPSQIYVNSSLNYEFSTIVQEKQNINQLFINGENLLNQIIKINVKVKDKLVTQKSFKVVGVYDSNKYYDNETFYISKSIIKNINNEIGYIPQDSFIKIIVDKIENLQEVENDLQEYSLLSNSNIQEEAQKNNNTSSTINEINISSVMHISTETLSIIKKLCLFFLCSTLTIFIIFLITTNINRTYLSSVDFGILKTEGYTNKDIQKITIIENIILCTISILFSIIIFFILQEFINFIINFVIYKDTVSITMNNIREQLYYVMKIPQKLNIFNIFVTSLILNIFIIINTFFINKKILSKNIKDLLSI